MSNSLRVSLLSGSFVLGLTACYVTEFDEQKDDAYYCQSDDDCLDTQICSQARCVDDQGPHLDVIGPEVDPPQVFPLDHPALNVTVDIIDGLTLDEGNTVEEGKGKLQLTIDPHKETAITRVVDVSTAPIPLDGGLEHGPHRVVAQAVYGDGTPYDNPSAKDHTVFFSTDGSARPQIAILEPGPGYVHVVGEPLEVTVINVGYMFVDNGMDCHVQEGCDPFAMDSACPLEMGCDAISMNGHTHIYLLPNYPDCLLDQPVGCNENYIASMRPNGGTPGGRVTAVINGDRFTEPGEFHLSAGMQYNDHYPYPNKEFVVYDQIPITLIER